MSTSTLQKIRYSFLLFTVFLSPHVMAKDRNIAGCVDENGIITFTDTLCYTVNEVTGNEVLGLVAKDRAMTKAPSIYDPFPLTDEEPRPVINTRLQSVTDMAITECSGRFKKYFKRKHPGADLENDVTFTKVIDQYENGSKISVSVASTLEYIKNDSRYLSTIECTVQNMQNDANWIVGFIEK